MKISANFTKPELQSLSLELNKQEAEVIRALLDKARSKGQFFETTQNLKIIEDLYYYVSSCMKGP